MSGRSLTFMSMVLPPFSRPKSSRQTVWPDYVASHPSRQHSLPSNSNFLNNFEPHATSIVRIFLFSNLAKEAAGFPQMLAYILGGDSVDFSLQENYND
jgi:hypothetical protein